MNSKLNGVGRGHIALLITCRSSSSCSKILTMSLIYIFSPQLTELAKLVHDVAQKVNQLGMLMKGDPAIVRCSSLISRFDTTITELVAFSGYIEARQGTRHSFIAGSSNDSFDGAPKMQNLTKSFSSALKTLDEVDGIAGELLHSHNRTQCRNRGGPSKLSPSVLLSTLTSLNSARISISRWFTEVHMSYLQHRASSGAMSYLAGMDWGRVDESTEPFQLLFFRTPFHISIPSEHWHVHRTLLLHSYKDIVDQLQRFMDAIGRRWVERQIHLNSMSISNVSRFQVNCMRNLWKGLSADGSGNESGAGMFYRIMIGDEERSSGTMWREQLVEIRSNIQKAINMESTWKPTLPQMMIPLPRCVMGNRLVVTRTVFRRLQMIEQVSREC